MSDKKYVMPAGEHQARVVHVVRCGKHTPRFDKFSKGSTPRLWITYEVLDEQNDEGKNRWLSFTPYGEPMNSYFTDKGKQADWLSDIGFKSNDEDSLRAAVGHPVWLDIVHNTNPKTGVTYANVGDVSKVRAKDAEDFPPLMNEGIYFDYYRPVKEDYIALPKWIKDYMKAADDVEETGNAALFKEWDDEGAKAYNEANGKGTQATPEKKAKPRAAKPADEYEDDVPF